MNRKNLRIAAALALALTAAAVQAQPRTYTLKSCLEEGLLNNYSLRIAKNDEQASRNNATLANAGYLPTLDLSAGYQLDAGTTRSTLRETGQRVTEKNVVDQTVDVGLDLNWTLFDGFNISTNYRQLQLLRQQGELNTRIALEDFVAALAAEYYNFVQQKIRLKNLRYAVQLSKERLRIVEARYHIGSFSRLDYQQAKVDFNADSASYMKQQELLHTSRINLNELMAIEDVDRPVAIHDSLINVDASLDFEALWRATLSVNASLLKASQNTRLAQMDYKKVRSRDYPYLRLNAGYGYTMKRRNAALAIENARLQRDELELSLRADLSNLWQAYQNNLEMLKLERQNLVAARDNHEIARERYMLGDLSGIEMREAQKSLLDAEERILTAEYDTKLCEISLLQISGRIMDYLK